MTSPEYYYNPDLHVEDNALVGAGTDAFLTWLGGLIVSSNVGAQVIYFVVSTTASVSTQVIYEANFGELDGVKGVFIGEGLEAEFYGSASVALAVALITAAGIGGAPLLAAAAGISYFNASFGNPLGGLLEFISEGNFDAEIQLTDANGKVIAGAIYDDGMPSNLPQAVSDLLNGIGESGDPSEGIVPTIDMSIFIRSDNQAAAIDEFVIYDGDMALRAAEMFHNGNIESFKSFDLNGRLYAQSTINGEIHRWIIARDQVIEVMEGVPDLNPNDLIKIPVYDPAIEPNSFHPSDIAFFKNGQMVGASDALLFLGDNQANTMIGSDAQSSLYGAGGNDILIGGVGKDYVYGGTGDDTLYASAYTNGLEGDFYHGGMAGGSSVSDGTDTVDYSNVGFGVTLEFGALQIEKGIIHKSGETDAGRVEDTLISIEKYRLTNNADHVKVAAIQTLELDGGDGADILDFSALSGAVVVDVFHGAAYNGGAYTINFTNFGEFIGTDNVAAGDVFFGSMDGAVYRGGEGVDILDYGFITAGRLDIDLRTGVVYKLGGNVVDKVYDIEVFGGSDRGDRFHSIEGATGIEFHGNGQGAYEKDVLDFSHYYTGGVVVSLSSGTVTDSSSGSMVVSGIEKVVGSDWDDTITGSSGADWLYGGESDDTIYGGDGNDYLFGGADYDDLYGGSGSDTYYFKDGDGFDNISDTSGAGDTIFLAGGLKFLGGDMVSWDASGEATIEGVTTFTDDIEYLLFADKASFLIENLGRVQPIISGPVGGEIGQTFYGSDFADDLIGTDDDDVFLWSLGNDTIDGGDGYDGVSYSGLVDKITMGGGGATVHFEHAVVYLGGEPVFDSQGHAVLDSQGNPETHNAGDPVLDEDGNPIILIFDDTLTHIEALTGTAYDDILNGDSGDNIINGGGGVDIIHAGEGNDVLSGNGELYGGSDDDVLSGSGELYGGDGNDVLLGSGKLYGGADDDVLTGNGELIGGSGNDWLTGTGILSGGAGSDHLEGSGTLSGGSGQDFLISTGGETILDGGSGNDYLSGGFGTTYIVDSGVDVIHDGGGGILHMAGSAGTAKYEYAENGSLVITSGGSTAVILNTIIGGISFNGGATVSGIPVNGTGFVENIFDKTIMGSSGGNVYTATSVSEDSLTLWGNDVYNFDAISLHNHQTTIGIFDVSSIGGLIVINNGVVEDVSVARVVGQGPFGEIGGSALMVYYGDGNSIILNGDSGYVSQNFDIEIGGVTYALDSLQVTTYGSAGDDRSGLIFADKIIGDLAGFSTDDIIYAGFGDDEIEGGLGNDFLYGEHGDDTIYGEEGNDTIDGGHGDDILFGGAGNDTFIDSDGNDIYHVGTGDTIQLGAGNNELIVIAGELSGVTLDLSAYEEIESDGTGLIRDFSGSSNGYSYKLLYGGNSLNIADNISPENTPILTFNNGSSATLDTILVVGYGSDDADSYHELNSQVDDLIYAGGGNDVFVMWSGNDTVYGGAGDDDIRAISALDIPLNEGSSLDFVGNLIAYGEAGDDVLFGGVGNDELYGGDGNDKILDISGGNNILSGGAGDDIFFVAWEGGDDIDGGDGSDTIALLYADFTNPISDGYEIDLAEQTFTNVFGTYQFTSIENALGSENDDVLIGSSQNNILGGGAGNDVLNGGAGDDTYSISGSTDAFGNLLLSGNDIITDTSGDDTIELTEVSSINSITITELGDDLKINMAGGGSVTVQGQLSGVSELQVEYLKLSDGTIYDLINYTNWYTGGGGNNDPDPDPIVATAAVDFIIGTPTTIDTADFSNSISGVNVNLITNSGSGGYAEGDILVFIENIIGSNFNDILTGNGENNTLTGGFGDDLLDGGAGDDTYIFNLGDGNNTITDISGFDVIQLGAGITLGDITFTQIGDDLDIQIASGFLVKDFYAGNADVPIEEIQFFDGSSFNLTSLLNNAPIAQDDVFNSGPDQPIIGNVLADNGNGVDSDPDGDVLSVVADVIITANGFVSISTDGSFIYAPNAGFIGADSFTYTVDDGNGGTSTATVNLTVGPVNDAPIAADDAFSGDQDLDITGNLLVDNGNGVDSDPDGDVLSVVAETITTANGSVVISANGDFTYTPTAGYTGADSFSYTLQDGNGGSTTATASLTLNTVGTVNMGAPLNFVEADFVSYTNQDKVNDTFAVTNNTELHMAGNSWKSLDFDYVVTGNTYVQLDYQTVVQGEIQGLIFLEQGLNVNASSTVHANASIIRLDGYQSISTGQSTLYSETAGTWETITIKLSDYNAVGTQIDNLVFVNDDDDDKTGDALFRNIKVFEDNTNIDPVAQDDAFSGDQNLDITGNLLVDNGNGADSDVNGDILSVVAGTITTANGSVVISANGDFAYTPTAGYIGADSFSYTLQDGNGGSTTATASLTLNTASTGNTGDPLNFIEADFVPYTNQDKVNNTFAVTNNTELHMAGNSWKSLDFDYVVTNNTYVQLDYQTVVQGEIQGLIFLEQGLNVNANSTVHANASIIRLDGYQSLSTGQSTLYSETAGTWETITIKLSDYNEIGTQIDNLVFVNDDDDDQTGDALFRNIKVFEDNTNADPVAQDDVFSGDQDLDITGNLLVDNGNGADSDPEGDTLSVVAETITTANGSVVISANGDFTYTPAAGYTGADSFSYTLQDGNSGTSTASVNITVNAAIGAVDAVDVLSFVEADFVSYTNQDKVNNIFAVTNNTELHMAGNSWKSLDFDYVVTNNTYVQLDYQTVVQGEIQGLIFLEQGLNVNANSTVHANASIIRLDGYQSISTGQSTLYSETAGTWETITIKLSDYNAVGTQIDNLVFVNDDDDDKTGDALFRDIKVFEEGTLGADTLNGSAFNETMFGRDGDDVLNGGDGDDALYGGAGSDYLYGNGGDDTLSGGAGIDMLYGQTGADTFVFEAASAFTNSDNVQDFDLSEGDKIDISDVLIGYDPLTDVISDFVQITDDGTHSTLYVDADGGADNFVQVASLFNVMGLTGEDALEASGNLITV